MKPYRCLISVGSTQTNFTNRREQIFGWILQPCRVTSDSIRVEPEETALRSPCCFLVPCYYVSQCVSQHPQLWIPHTKHFVTFRYYYPSLSVLRWVLQALCNLGVAHFIMQLGALSYEGINGSTAVLYFWFGKRKEAHIWGIQPSAWLIKT